MVAAYDKSDKSIAPQQQLRILVHVVIRIPQRQPGPLALQ